MRTLYGGNPEAYFSVNPARPGQTQQAPVYDSPNLTTQVTDLMTVDGTGNPSAAITTVQADNLGFFSFFGPDSFTKPLYAPKGYLAPGVPDPSAGYLRIDPNPNQTYGKVEQVDFRDFGKFGTAIDDDNTTAFALALSQLAAGGSTISTLFIPESTYGVGLSSRQVAGRGIYIVGALNKKAGLGQRPGAVFRMMTQTAGLEMGVESVSQSVQGGRWGNFSIDAQGIASQPLRIKLMSQADSAGPVQVKNAARYTDPSGANDPTGGGDPANDLTWHRANCAVLVDSIQNSRMQFNIANNAGCGLVVDRAASGNTFEIEVADSGSTAASPPPGGWAVVIQQSEDGTAPGAMSPQNVSSNDTFIGRGGIERTGPAAYGLLNHLAGFKTSFRDMFLADGKPNSGSRPLIRQRYLGLAPSGPLHLGKIVASGGKNTGTFADVGDTCTLVLNDALTVRGFKWGYKLGSKATVIEMVGQLWNVDQLLDPSSAGSLEENVTMPSDGAVVVSRTVASAPIIRGQLAQQSAQVTTIAGSTAVTTTDGSVKFTAANVGGSIRIAAAGPLGTDGVTYADLSTTVTAITGGGTGVTLNTAAAVSLTNALASYAEKFHRVEIDADGTVRVGGGDIAPATVLTPTQWAALSGVLTAANPRVYKQTADESQTVTNSTTFVTDNRLTKSVNASTAYRFEVCVYPDGPAAGDIQVGLVFPTGTTGSYHTRAPGTTASTGGSPVSVQQTVLKSLGTATTVGTVDTGNQQPVTISGRFTTSTTAGTFGLRWTQGTANASALTVKADSWLEVVPV